jgi:hypothetical protein
MALTTKFINANLSITLSTTLAANASFSMSPAVSGTPTSSVANRTSFASSSFSSIIYTVPAGRTAKVYLPQIITVSLSRSLSESEANILWLGGSRNLGFANGYLNQGTTLTFIYNDSYSQIITPAVYHPSIISSFDVGSVYPTSVVGGPYPSYSNAFQSFVTIQRSHFEFGSGFAAAYQYRFLGPGDSIVVAATTTLSAQKTIAGSTLSGTLWFSYSFSGSYLGKFDFYLPFMVIEESGS